MQQGNINVNTENIFPIIKKFLYSDQDIFLRELISNAVDATQKLNMLAKSGEVKDHISNNTIEVLIDKEAKTLSIRDRGIGMTAEEIDKYINQIAFSSAEEFVEKFKDLDDKAQIIGHFGLGFYSAFMVADSVDIISKSYKDTPASKWSCDGSPNFTLEETTKDTRGTDIVLHINDDSLNYLEESKIHNLLNTYCKFLPIPIQFGTETYQEATGKKDKDGKEEMVSKERARIINNTSPAWTKSPSELKDEDYLAFYKELYPFAEDPMFWIHLNVDFPFNLTGILYFPKLKKSFEAKKNNISLYSNQVFVTDNVENIVPEFLTLLHGIIDSPDIPLNVSRSYLQSDGNVKKISNHISKKVSDKLSELFKSDRKAYEEKWESIGLFTKYGMISDEKFYDRSKANTLLQDVEGIYFTIDELKEKIKPLQTDKNEQVVALYTNNLELQDSFIKNAQKQSYVVLNMDSIIDNHFMQHLEMKEDKFQFKRVDADTLDKLIEKEESIASVLSEKEEEKLKELYTNAIENSAITVDLKPLSPEDLPVLITQSEFMRRMKEMQEMGGGQMAFMGDMPMSYTLVVNTNHPAAAKVLGSKKKTKDIINQLVDLAMLNQGLLKGKKLTSFIERSVENLV